MTLITNTIAKSKEEITTGTYFFRFQSHLNSSSASAFCSSLRALYASSFWYRPNASHRHARSRFTASSTSCSIGVRYSSRLHLATDAGLVESSSTAFLLVGGVAGSFRGHPPLQVGGTGGVEPDMLFRTSASNLIPESRIAHSDQQF